MFPNHLLHWVIRKNLTLILYKIEPQMPPTKYLEKVVPYENSEGFW